MFVPTSIDTGTSFTSGPRILCIGSSCQDSNDNQTPKKQHILDNDCRFENVTMPKNFKRLHDLVSTETMRYIRDKKLNTSSSCLLVIKYNTN